MSDGQSFPKFDGNKIGQHLGQGFEIYKSQWQNWLPPMLMAFGVGLVATLACIFPVYFVMGPISCGLYLCAFRCVRNQPVELAHFQAGWSTAGRSIPAGLIMILVQSGPMILLMAFFFGGLMAITSAADGGNPPPWVGIAILAGFCLYFLGLFACIAWAIWLGTRTMFMFPLIADRGMGWREAWNESFRATRQDFWWLLLTHFVAQLIANLGVYFLYVGALFTVPIYFTIMAAAYEERLGIRSIPATFSPSPAGPQGSNSKDAPPIRTNDSSNPYQSPYHS